MSTFNLSVHGMTCAGCTARLKRVLEAMDGVTTTEVVLETGQVRVDYENIGIDEIKSVITDAGFVVI